MRLCQLFEKTSQPFMTNNTPLESLGPHAVSGQVVVWQFFSTAPKIRRTSLCGCTPRAKWSASQWSPHGWHVERRLIHFWNPLIKASKIGYAFPHNFTSVVKLKTHKLMQMQCRCKPKWGVLQPYDKGRDSFCMIHVLGESWGRGLLKTYLEQFLSFRLRFTNQSSTYANCTLY